MKKFVLEFLRRGSIACGLGPIVLAILYLIVQKTSAVDMLSVNQVCTGIFSITALAFIAGGMNAVYQLERLPLMVAILLHGGVLYLSYLGTYLLNDWLDWGVMPVLVFSGIFILGYLVIWISIYSITRSRTRRVNEMLKMKQQSGNGR